MNESEQKMVESEIQKPKPPMEWFSGIAEIHEGILGVWANDNFLSQGDGKVEWLYNEWRHMMGNTSKSDSLEDRDRARVVIEEAEAFITVTTGFTPMEIATMRQELKLQFKGKFEAPFELEFYDSEANPKDGYAKAEIVRKRQFREENGLL